MRILLGLAFISVNAIASPQDKAVVRKLARDYQQTKTELMQDEISQRRILSGLFDINKKMKKIVIAKSDLIQESQLTESVTKELAERILVLENKLKEQKVLMRERLTAIYKFGGQGLARLLFSSQSSAHLERNLKILGIIAKRDLDLIKDYMKSMTELSSKRKKFTLRLAQLRSLERKIQEQENALTSENLNKTKMLAEIKRLKEFRLSKLSGLRAKTNHVLSHEDSGVLDLLFRPSIFEQKGRLPLPVEGPILRKFGIIRDPDYNVSLAHKGIFISATPGSKIRAVFEGKVSYVGALPGFGQTIIIDHGDHYYSVYGFNRLSLVSVGAEVQQNHVIAESGLSSAANLNFSESGLYFEIRHFSEPYNPQHWLKGSTL